MYFVIVCLDSSPGPYLHKVLVKDATNEADAKDKAFRHLVSKGLCTHDQLRWDESVLVAFDPATGCSVLSSAPLIYNDPLVGRLDK